MAGIELETDTHHYERLDMDLVYRAYAHNSWEPEKRAKQIAEEVNGHLAEVEEWAQEMATNPNQMAEVDGALDWYRREYLAKVHAWLSARSRTANWAVTGRSGFNVSRNQKRMQTEQRRIDEMIAFQKRGQKTIESRLKGLRTEEQIDVEAWERLKVHIDRDMGVVAGIDSGIGRFAGFNRSAFTTSVAGQIRRMAKQNPALAARALDYIRECQNPARPFFAARNSVWNVAGAYTLPSAAQEAQ